VHAAAESSEYAYKVRSGDTTRYARLRRIKWFSQRRIMGNTSAHTTLAPKAFSTGSARQDRENCQPDYRREPRQGAFCSLATIVRPSTSQPRMRSLEDS